MLCKEGLALKGLKSQEVFENGGQFLLFLTEFLLLSIRGEPRRDSIF